MQALAHKNVPYIFVTSLAFQEYVDHVSESERHAPTRWDLVEALEEICDILTAKTQKQMSESLFLAVCADSWSSAGRHLTAATGGNPGLNIYLNSYKNLGSEDAQGAANAIQQGVMTSLGFKVDMDPHDSNFPTAKVAVMILDSTALMPATARALRSSKGMQWAPCMAHVANLLLLDQLKVPTIASLLAHAKQIAVGLLEAMQVHPDHAQAKLGITDKLLGQHDDSDSPSSFWQLTCPTTCLLHEAALLDRKGSSHRGGAPLFVCSLHTD
jgi:hypothetical protein